MSLDKRIPLLSGIEHQGMLQVLYSDFGLNSPPKEIPIEIRDCGFTGLDWEGDGWEIRLADSKHSYWMTPLDEVLHETGHYLHFMKCPEIKKRIALLAKLGETSLQNGFASIPQLAVIEFVAELAMVTFRLRGSKRPNSIKSFVDRNELEGSSLFLSTYFAYLNNPNLLREVLQMKTEEEAYAIAKRNIEKVSPWLLEYDSQIFPRRSHHCENLRTERLP